jgi:hypothetical protein
METVIRSVLMNFSTKTFPLLRCTLHKPEGETLNQSVSPWLGRIVNPWPPYRSIGIFRHPFNSIIVASEI